MTSEATSRSNGYFRGFSRNFRGNSHESKNRRAPFVTGGRERAQGIFELMVGGAVVRQYNLSNLVDSPVVAAAARRLTTTSFNVFNKKPSGETFRIWSKEDPLVVPLVLDEGQDTRPRRSLLSPGGGERGIPPPTRVIYDFYLEESHVQFRDGRALSVCGVQKTCSPD